MERMAMPPYVKAAMTDGGDRRISDSVWDASSGCAQRRIANRIFSEKFPGKELPYKDFWERPGVTEEDGWGSLSDREQAERLAARPMTEEALERNTALWRMQKAAWEDPSLRDAGCVSKALFTLQGFGKSRVMPVALWFESGEMFVLCPFHRSLESLGRVVYESWTCCKGTEGDFVEFGDGDFERMAGFREFSESHIDINGQECLPWDEVASASFCRRWARSPDLSATEVVLKDGRVLEGLARHGFDSYFSGFESCQRGFSDEGRKVRMDISCTGLMGLPGYREFMEYMRRAVPRPPKPVINYEDTG